MMGADQTLADAERVRDWIIGQACESFVERDCYQAVKGSLHEIERVRAALAVLEDHATIRRLPPELRDGPGRRPSPTWLVNPQLSSHYSHNTHNRASLIDGQGSGDTGNTGRAPGADSAHSRLVEVMGSRSDVPMQERRDDYATVDPLDADDPQIALLMAKYTRPRS